SCCESMFCQGIFGVALILTDEADIGQHLFVFMRRLTKHAILTLRGPVLCRHDRHHGGLPGTIAAEQTVDLIFFKVEGDIIKGNGVFETSSDTRCFNCPDTLCGIRGSHGFSLLGSMAASYHRKNRFGIESNCPCVCDRVVAVLMRILYI